MSIKEFTPELVTRLDPNEIFVFGSNLEGAHGGGAARAAVKYFGAKWGQGVGIQGQCYAIPTMHGRVEAIRPYVDDFIKFAAENPSLRFLVTPIGCGIAGFKPEEIAPLFKGALLMDNVILPKTFVDILSGVEAGEAETRDQRKSRLVQVFKDTMSMIIEEIPLMESVENSIAGTRLYPEQSNFPVNKCLGKNLKVSVSSNRTFQAATAMCMRNPGKRVAVLNFASATSPGGVLKGGVPPRKKVCAVVQRSTLC